MAAAAPKRSLKFVNPLLLLFAVLPGLLIAFAMFRVDRYEPEPFVPLALSFVFGAGATVPAVWVEMWAFEHLSGEPTVLETFVLAFVVVGLNEEVFKFLVLRLVAYPFSFFNEPLDGIVYSVMAAMGFATMENLAYADRFGLETVVLRALTAVPAHLFFAIVAGYFAGVAKFAPPARRARLLVRGLLLAVALHGFYDLLMLQNWLDWLFVLAVVGLYMCLYFSGQLVREHLENSPFRK